MARTQSTFRKQQQQRRLHDERLRSIEVAREEKRRREVAREEKNRVEELRCMEIEENRPYLFNPKDSDVTFDIENERISAH